jgi:hypothetical protein
MYKPFPPLGQNCTLLLKYNCMRGLWQWGLSGDWRFVDDISTFYALSRFWVLNFMWEDQGDSYEMSRG